MVRASSCLITQEEVSCGDWKAASQFGNISEMTKTADDIKGMECLTNLFNNIILGTAPPQLTGTQR